jgi:hypothetical protein
MWITLKRILRTQDARMLPVLNLLKIWSSGGVCGHGTEPSGGTLLDQMLLWWWSVFTLYLEYQYIIEVVYGIPTFSNKALKVNIIANCLFLGLMYQLRRLYNADWRGHCILKDPGNNLSRSALMSSPNAVMTDEIDQTPHCILYSSSDLDFEYE